METNIEEKILNKIKEENLKPKSVWYFIARDYGLWTFVFLSILLAGLSISPIIFILQNLEVGYIKHVTNNTLNFILLTFPYPWIILCGITTFFAVKAWEKTKHGYKFNGKKVLLTSFLTSLALGLILNLWNLGRMMDNEIRLASFGNYKNFEQRREEFWFNPEAGRISGTVDDISTTTFNIHNPGKDFSERIDFTNLILGEEEIYPKNNVRVVGYSLGTSTAFRACAVFSNELEPKPKNIRQKHEEIKRKLDENLETYEECKRLFEEGRAYFRPKLIKN